MSHIRPMTLAPQLAPYACSLDVPGIGRVAYVDSAPEAAAGHDTLVLVHGLQDEADTWRHVFTPLAYSQRVLALDLPGFGRSDKRKRRYAIDFFAAAVLAWLDALGVSRVALAGNSLGGMVSEFITLTQPQRVRSLTLIAGTLVITQQPAGPRGSLLRRLFAAWLDKRYFLKLRRSPQAAFDTLRPYYANLQALPQADRDFLFQRVNERVWDEEQRLAALSVQMNFVPFFMRQMARIRREVPRLAVPTQVLWGTKDAIFPLANGQARAKMQAGAGYVEITDAGHLPQQEQAARVLAALGA
jgi:pimeloyl-ACP methyl ester carboxylesterase